MFYSSIMSFTQFELARIFLANSNSLELDSFAALVGIYPRWATFAKTISELHGKKQS